jgi:hypothetical protein
MTLIAASALLAGCVATTSDVVPAGKDTYMVSAMAAGSVVLAGHSMINATKAANAYCANLGKVMIIRNTQSVGTSGMGSEHSNLIFSCVSEDDPEYKRPELHKE